MPPRNKKQKLGPKSTALQTDLNGGNQSKVGRMNDVLDKALALQQ